MTRAEAVARVADALRPDWLTIACNGLIGRELYAHADAPSRFYMIGSMGLASSIGLGLALVRPLRTVVVFDGDGNVLMSMGALGSIAAAAPANFYHVVFDNEAHGSTGGQCTISGRVPIERVAAAAGYGRTIRLRSAAELNHTLSTFFIEPGPAMLLVEIERCDAPSVGRVEPAPAELTVRFRRNAMG